MGTCKTCRWRSSKMVFGTKTCYKCALEKLRSRTGINFHHDENYSCTDYQAPEPEIIGKLERTMSAAGEYKYTCTVCKANIHDYWLAWSECCPNCNVKLRA